MTGLDFKVDGQQITLCMRSDNPESLKWSRLDWYKWIINWLTTLISLSECSDNSF